MEQSKSFRKWPLIALAAGLALASGAGSAWAHDGHRDHRRGDRDRFSITYHVGSPGYGHPHQNWSHRHTARHTDTQVVVVPPSNIVVVNVTNANGSYTPVTLRQEGGSYIGPRGERYLHLPTEEQLRGAYGLK